MIHTTSQPSTNIPPPAETVMRATFPPSHSRQSTPVSSSQQLDAATPRQNALNLTDISLKLSDRPEDSGPIIYESASRAPGSSSQEVPIFTTPPSGEPLRSIRSGVHDLHSPPTRSPNTLFDEPSLATPNFYDPASAHRLVQPGTTDTAAGEAAKPRETLNMNASDSFGKPSSRGRSYSNTSRRGPPGHPPQQQPPPQAFGPPVGYATAHDQSQGFSSQYAQAGVQYGQRGPFITQPAQYTMSSGPRMVTQPTGGAQYSFPSHPGLQVQDATMHPQNQLLGYPTSSMMPVVHPHYPYTPGHSPPEAASSSTSMGHSYPTSSVGSTSQALYSTTHAMASSHPPSQPVTPPYSAPGPYAPRYPTPQFVYPPTTFATPSNTLYQTSYTYGQPYRPPASAPPDSDTSHSQGVWWFLPSGSRPVPQPHYDSYSPQPYPMYGSVQTHEIDPYVHAPQSGSSGMTSPLYPMVSPRIPPPPQQHFPPVHLPPSLPQQQPAPDPPPPPPPLNVNVGQISRSISEPARSQAAHSPSVLGRTSLARPPSSTRKAYHPSPPSNRSEWVMWAGNVPSDATEEELLRFFNRAVSPSVSAGSSNSAFPGFGTSPAPPPPSSSLSSPTDVSPSSPGVQSIFLISRSQCAFVNYVSEQHLHAAIARFNGQPLRPHDVRCPRLVCRVRAREDDLKAGVGGQRGAGVHSKWIKEQRAKAKAAKAAGSSEVSSPSEHDVMTSPGSSPVEAASSIMRSLSLGSADDLGIAGGSSTRRMSIRRMKKASAHSNSSESYASTNSSMLVQHFPKRYFILKSLSQFDLDLSVEKGLWATQKHNEGILDQAYRTSQDVYLIFGVNKSGEFYGYAKMAGPIHKVHGEQGGDRRVSWASRSSIESSPARRATTGGPSSPSSSRKPTVPYFSPSDGPRYEESPLPIDESKEATLALKPKLDLHSISAPAVMLDPHNPLSTASNVPRYGERSYDPVLPAAPLMLQQSQAPSDDFELDPKAPDRAVKQRSADEAEEDPTGIKRWDAVPRMSGTSSLGSVMEEEDEDQGGQPASFVEKGKGKAREDDDEQGVEHQDDMAAATTQRKEDRKDWGESFRVEWIKTTRLPFYRTRHLRNPWNHDREVKVSRDGTELEPSVGQALLDEWDKPDPSPPAQLPGRAGTRTSPPDIAQPKEGGSE